MESKAQFCREHEITVYDLNKWTKLKLLPVPKTHLKHWLEILNLGFLGSGFYWVKEGKSWEPCSLILDTYYHRVKIIRLGKRDSSFLDPKIHLLKGPITP
jgi:hypothetical protein